MGKPSGRHAYVTFRCERIADLSAHVHKFLSDQLESHVLKAKLSPEGQGQSNETAANPPVPVGQIIPSPDTIHVHVLKIARRTNYGSDRDSRRRKGEGAMDVAPAPMSLWRWEVKEQNMHLLPPDTRAEVKAARKYIKLVRLGLGLGSRGRLVLGSGLGLWSEGRLGLGTGIRSGAMS